MHDLAEIQARFLSRSCWEFLLGITPAPTLSLLLSFYFTEGEFGIVYRGLLYQDKIPKVVAVKTLKGTNTMHF